MTSPSYCAPCISDLALVREAVTSVAGTASCMAHAVLLTHGSDDPGRRRQRLDVLKDLATGKAETAEPAEQVKLELLVQEYGLAGAMDMGGPARRGPQPPRQGGQGGQHQHQHGQPSAPGEGRKSRRNRPRPGDRPQGQSAGPRPEGGETAPVTPAPGPAGEGAPIEAVAAATQAPAQAAPEQPASAPAAPEQPTPAAPQPAPADVPPSSAPDA